MTTDPPSLIAAIPPGVPFVALLAAIAAAGLVVHALLLRMRGETWLSRWTRRIEGACFCAVLGAMIVLSGAQVVLRNFFHGGVLWLDPLVRTLVLWVGFLGALTATSHGRHLHIDILQRVVPRRAGGPLVRGLSLLAAACCMLLANAAYIYLGEERGSGTTPFLGIPSWVVQSALLWGFAMMAYRFLVQVLWPAPHEEPIGGGELRP